MKIYRIIVAAALFASSTSQAQVLETQLNLTEKQIQAFIAVQQDMSETFERVARHGLSNQAQAKYQAELKARTKRNGFKNIAEYQAVAGTIASVMAAIDLQTKMFRDPQVAIQKELDQLTADKTITDHDRQKLEQELKAALKSTHSGSSERVASERRSAVRNDHKSLGGAQPGKMMTIPRQCQACELMQHISHEKTPAAGPAPTFPSEPMRM